MKSATVRARHLWALPAAVGVLFVGAGLGWTFAWGPVVLHRSAWVQAGDLWGTYRSAQFVAWGDIGGIAHAITLPGIAVLLAPVALAATAFHWVAGSPFPLAHPSAWPLLYSAALVVGAAALVPLDRLAGQLGVAGWRRWALCLGEAVVLWPVVAMWGHPEDALAVALGTGALLAARSGRVRGSGWLFGLAVAFQPFVLAFLPVLLFVAVPCARQRLAYLMRAAVPSMALLAIPLATAWSATVHTLLDQANFPRLDHPTPWLSLAPVITPAHWVAKKSVIRTAAGFHLVHGRTLVGPIVATGPGHTLALLLACGLGVWAWRHRMRLEGIVWLVALCLGLRCAFEAVMVSYYIWPCLALLLISAAVRGGWRFPAAFAVSTGATVFAEYHFGPWLWFVPLMAMLAAGLAIAWPAGGLVFRGPVGGPPAADTRLSSHGGEDVLEPAALAGAGAAGS